jgi:uncharacterized membrane protein YeaQ/YmgE (transglycosylase-associated protein family)
MQGLGLLGTILIGAIAGWVAEKLMKANHGLLVNIVLGIVGALIGNGILTFVTGATLGGLIGQLIIGAAGACLLIWAYRALRG